MSLLSMSLIFLAWMVIFCSQKVGQRPALDGVITIHLGPHGDLKVWNQPIRLQELSALLERAAARSGGSTPLVVRLIPDPTLPWGAIHRMLIRFQPTPHERSWTLQLQLP